MRKGGTVRIGYPVYTFLELFDVISYLAGIREGRPDWGRVPERGSKVPRLEYLARVPYLDFEAGTEYVGALL